MAGTIRTGGIRYSDQIGTTSTKHIGETQTKSTEDIISYVKIQGR